MTRAYIETVSINKYNFLHIHSESYFTCYEYYFMKNSYRNIIFTGSWWKHRVSRSRSGAGRVYPLDFPDTYRERATSCCRTCIRTCPPTMDATWTLTSTLVYVNSHRTAEHYRQRLVDTNIITEFLFPSLSSIWLIFTILLVFFSLIVIVLTTL